jgi:transglutaminase-like putative cysteine protease
VLTRFDGREWSPARAFPSSRGKELSQLQVSGAPVRYEVTLEGNNHPWLPLLDATPDAPVLPGYAVRMGWDLQWSANRPIGELVRFEVQSYPQFRYGPRTPEPALQENLALPPGFNPRTQQLAQALKGDPRYAGADAAALVEVLLTKLRTEGYRYTLDPGVYGSNSADEFWFDRKEGFCEHIASSFVLLLRALGVPSRVVTGYQGGERNGVDGLWTVRQSDAHAWAEVWMAGQGWVRVDPTSAVAPGRTGLLQRLAAPRSAVAQALGAISPGFEINLRALWEATNTRWNQWVLNYSQARQLNLLRNIGFSAPSWEDLGVLLLGVVATISLLGAAWAQWERLRQDPWLRLLHGANRRLQQAGLALAPNTPPRQLAVALQHSAAASHAAHTQDAAEVERIRDWLMRLEAWRYAPQAAPAQSGRVTLGTLRRQFRQLRWPRHLTDKN